MSSAIPESAGDSEGERHLLLAAPNEHRARLARAGVGAGSAVAVRNRFLGSWTEGFEVVEERDGRYVVRRVSDGVILPGTFESRDVRANDVVGAGGVRADSPGEHSSFLSV